MSEERTRVKISTRSILEKFDKDATAEDIASGKAKPYEVIEVNDEIEVDEDQALKMGFRPHQLRRVESKDSK